MNEKVHILLVEDDDGDVLLIRESLALTTLNTQLRVVSNGESALDVLFRRPPFIDEETPQLVILDLNLPRKNGLEVLREMRAVPSLAHLPVIVLTTSRAHQDIARSYELGANCFLSKPLNFDEFASVGDIIEYFWRSWPSDLPCEVSPCADLRSIA